MTVTLSPDQQTALEKIKEWFDEQRSSFFMPKQTLTLGGLAGTGKAQRHGSLVQTPAGPAKIEDLQVGDLVFGAGGASTLVRGVFPQGRKIGYRVTFRDRTSVVVDGAHLWTVRLQGKTQWQTRTTTDLLAGGLRNAAGYKYQIPLTQPVEYPERVLPVDPYVVGAFLGDGANLHSTPILCIPDEKQPILDRIRHRLPEWVEVRTTRQAHCNYHKFTDPRQYHQNALRDALQTLGVQGRSPDRSIPQQYLTASTQQRWDLLQGLMDTDGSSKGNRIEFSTKSSHLADDVAELVQSLGGTAIIRPQLRKRDGSTEYSVNVKLLQNPFTLPYKAEGWKPSAKNPPSRYIVSIEPDSEAAEYTCISVEAEDGLYLTDHYIVTHNTTIMGHLDEIAPLNKIWFATFTGKAASVLRSKLPAGALVTTLHSLLYLPRSTLLCRLTGMPIADCRKLHAGTTGHRCTAVEHVSFDPKGHTLDGFSLIVIDEASMVNRRIYEDVLALGVPVLAVGDHGQLEPIFTDNFSLMRDPDIRLEKIHRQAEGSPVLKMAHQFRTTGQLEYGDYGGGSKKIRGAEMNSLPFDPDSLVVCSLNRTRKLFNQMYRSALSRTGDPVLGEKVICLNNNNRERIFNGLTGVIADILDMDGIGMRMTVEFDDGHIWTGSALCSQFGQDKTLRMGDEEFSPGYEHFDFGYAMTVHKAQGSQADSVIFVEEPLPTIDHARLGYTAVTRASKKVVVVG